SRSYARSLAGETFTRGLCGAASSRLNTGRRLYRGWTIQTRSAHHFPTPGCATAERAARRRAMELKRFILATAGHVDHGKSALVRALTGTDPDRLPEEKLRGITIELGFAQLEL